MKLKIKERRKKSRLVFLIAGKRKSVLTDVGELIKYRWMERCFLVMTSSVGSINRIKSQSRHLGSNQMN